MENLIIQAARDYDMDIEDVRKIAREGESNFYENLELFIKNRAERNSSPKPERPNRV